MLILSSVERDQGDSLAASGQFGQRYGLGRQLKTCVVASSGYAKNITDRRLKSYFKRL